MLNVGSFFNVKCPKMDPGNPNRPAALTHSLLCLGQRLTTERANPETVEFCALSMCQADAISVALQY